MLAAAALGIANFSARAQDTAGGVTSVHVSEEGRQVYEQICQACHMADAKGSGAAGGAGANIPALAGNAHLADKAYPIAILIKGRGAMPWFTEILTPAQMAAVITYVRGHFNNYQDPVTEADVKKIAFNPPPVPN
ncbi:MAG: cytochrome c [Sphingomonadales bacterium]|nr:cytochrome c [Sphingomonadales bacterium]